MNSNRLRKTLRYVIIALVIAAAATLMVAMAIQFGIRIANGWQQYAVLPAAHAPTREDNIIVFAPHADDETLGCGGMLAMAKESGARVRVVLITNGDGFWFAASRDCKTLRLTPDRIIGFAYRRQRETLNALSILGVKSSEVTFLGYPDRGLAPMWSEYWGHDTLYTSRATRKNSSPYSNSYTPHAPYCGEALLKDLGNILKETKPTDVYLPHPLDNHSDHYATYCFVTAAMEQLHAEGVKFAGNIRIHTYLVHRGDWPVPKGDHPKELLVPPNALANGDTKWSTLAIPSNIVKEKRLAIKQYKTQFAVEKGFLMSFARGNELFGSLPVRKVAIIKPGSITIDGDPGDWLRIPPAVVDPVRDYVVAGMHQGGDVRTIYACTDNSYLFIRVDCARNLSKRITYTINLRGISKQNSNDIYTVAIKPSSKHVPGIVDWAYKKNVLEIALPLDKLRLDADLFVQVKTKMMNFTVDNTGWHSLEFRKAAKKE
ncbi:MAG: PIG-L family deacetylase [Armatimonadetes bacterium]|nr:PIG-L family deacetylase [Armatimonadota bacterium]